ncbi:inhibitor of growth protein 5 [Homalodisca vitripennis]|uniref:Inhibitor of growth protein n=1 Tax=Homalodisca liturata TaxID=320908 RepID=A0A1B6JXE8_9HEMI|nr:inhibitor of growth protein 5 [Homalodisca vitripennis]
MTSALYLEQYLDSLEHLPIELQRNFTLMRDLDARAQNVMRNIDKMADEYLQNIKLLSPDKKKEKMNDIMAQFNKAKEYGDDKVQLAIQTYELVDKHIRRLDSDLARFESEIQDKALSNTRSQEDTDPKKRGRKKQKDRGEKKKRVGVGSSGEEEGGKTVRKKAKKGGGKNNSGPGKGASTNSVVGAETGLAAVLPGLAGITHTADVLDMPVDPNEPTYCLCHQVSYGEMIGCDNPDCPIEWFHFACVGLVTKPKGKWFCPKCIADRKKK